LSDDAHRPLAGRHAIVTGGGRGIGLAVAEALASRGAVVTLMGRNESVLRTRAAELSSRFAADVAHEQVDVTDPALIEAAFRSAAARFGPAAILVNNAGVARAAPFQKTDERFWREVLDADTCANGPGTTIASIVDGSAKLQHPSVIAGVANTGTDRNWTGHLLAQANWYAFGRLAWDHQLSSEQIADEWTRLTFGHNAPVVATISRMLLGSRETVVNYSMPLGLTHIMAEGHHYGPGPWVDNLGRADWNSTYYHRADAQGLGFDRTATGSNALAQYAPEWQKLWGNLESCPENLLLWFHHVPWDHRMKSGRTLWDELCLRYQQGVDEVRALRRDWDSLQGRIDSERFTHVAQRLARQEQEAIRWRDACLLYFQQFSQRPLPAGVEPAAHPLEHYTSLALRNMPGHR